VSEVRNTPFIIFRPAFETRIFLLVDFAVLCNWELKEGPEDGPAEVMLQTPEEGRREELDKEQNVSSAKIIT
jgi:hypothetical protein